jgi:CheY-like chemotaxis protein
MMTERKPKVLYVEDVPEAGRMISAILRDFDVVTVGSKAEAVQSVLNIRPDLILMDYYLPDGNGIEACNLIRSFDSRTPILFITGSEMFTETLARDVGAQGLLKKARPTFASDLVDRACELSA